MKFSKYNSIENAENSKLIKYIYEGGFSGGEWCATVKVHGANYSFWCNDEELRTAKRSCLMDGDGGNFYGSYSVYARYQEKVRALYLKLKKDLSTLNVLALYGEIFGGLYAHPDVERVKDSKKVQDGIQYCPHNDFYLFDVAYLDSEGTPSFETTDLVEEVGIELGIPYAKIVHRGSLEEMLKLDPVFEDPIHKLFGLPLIENNMAEGWVIRPRVAKFFRDGSRVILKKKNPKFSEIKQKARKLPSELPLEVAELLSKGLAYVTENRLNNVLSHGYEITQKDFGKLLGLFSKDIHEDFCKDYEDEVRAVDPAMMKQVSKNLNAEAANLVRGKFLEITSKY